MKTGANLLLLADDATLPFDGEGRPRLGPARGCGCTIRRVATPQVAVGVDVGEDFLDLAVLRANPLTLTHHRIGLRGIEDHPARILSERLAASCPDSGPQWLALIDSPRWPRDLELSKPADCRRDPEPAGRSLDRALREMLRDSDDHQAMRLSMFPTPKLEYFRRCADAATCKPHLRAIYHYLFEAERAGSGISAPIDVPGIIQGGTFTRFMLAGFLTFRAWEALGVPALEAYPDLQYRLRGGSLIAPKRQRAAALESRIEILLQLRRKIGIAAAAAAVHSRSSRRRGSRINRDGRRAAGFAGRFGASGRRPFSNYFQLPQRSAWTHLRKM